MDSTFKIPGDDTVYKIRFQDRKCISISTSFCVIRAYKRNPHFYELRVFMRASEMIYYYDAIRSKSDLLTYLRFLISTEKEFIKCCTLATLKDVRL